MSDNLKTWPEKIFVDTCSYTYVTNMSWYIEKEKSENPDNIEYIRADIAKEREDMILEQLREAQHKLLASYLKGRPTLSARIEEFGAPYLKED